MLETLLNSGYPELIVCQKSIDSFETTVFKNEIPNIFSMSILKHLVHNSLDDMTSDYSYILSLFPRNDFIYYFFNMTDHKWVKRLAGISFKYVSTNFKMQIPFDFCEKMFVKNTLFPKFYWRLLSSNFASEKFLTSDLFDDLTFSKKCDNRFSIRVMSKQVIDLPSILKNPHILTPSLKSHMKKIIIHIHGGGFITMSSGSHQSYLRKFVRENDVLLFSIDYPLAPKKKFKQIFDSILKGYLFIKVVLSDFARTNTRNWSF